MYNSYSLFISCFVVTLGQRKKVRFYHSCLKLCHARPRERKTPARQAAGTQASPVKGTFAVLPVPTPRILKCCTRWRVGTENRYVIKLNSEFYGSTFSTWMKRAKPLQDTLQASPPLNSSLLAIIIMKEMPIPTPLAHNPCKGGGAGGIFFLVQHQWREK